MLIVFSQGHLIVFISINRVITLLYFGLAYEKSTFDHRFNKSIGFIGFHQEL